MPTNLLNLFQVNVPFLYLLKKTSGCIERKHCLKWVKILHYFTVVFRYWSTRLLWRTTFCFKWYLFFQNVSGCLHLVDWGEIEIILFDASIEFYHSFLCFYYFFRGSCLYACRASIVRRGYLSPPPSFFK